MRILSNGVITLRRPRSEDAADIAAAVQASLPELEPWMPWATSRYDEAAALQWMANPSEYAFTIIDVDGSIVGICGLNAIDELNNGPTSATGYVPIAPAVGSPPQQRHFSQPTRWRI